MIDLTQSVSASPLVHTAPRDPGVEWTSRSVAIDAPPDTDVNPSPDALWPANAARSGVCGAVSPRVVALPGGGYRLYYTQMLPRTGFPKGANDYDNATSRILSARSVDGDNWIPEPGVRLSPQQGGAGDFRVVSSEVVPLTDGQRLRMYYECCAGPQSQQNSIRSAISSDGLNWIVETGARFELSGCNVSSPRIQFLNDGRWRLYCNERGKGIISAVSDDEGISFRKEPGIRVAENSPFDRHAAFACEILRLPSGSYRMYYAGYGEPSRADILTAVSEDGLSWEKASEPVLLPGSTTWDAVKRSEMCVIWNSQAPTSPEPFRMLYEACDGTADGQRGVWRIASANSIPPS
ncbi:hypothetical protein [Fuerstiella marisgermanici]|uniref:Exo-alpha-sialidase n=1 Tax=Fuerstiella marisgermanici TaxID=1891926 RepID=A0A1P8WSI7_9PLAN|nr:hypothetical protein [Fuerstiella marisgermanici]APZ97037.1 hypothetical protein Fuma_06715 [Fuerstiella marisgermanici]